MKFETPEVGTPTLSLTQLIVSGKDIPAPPFGHYSVHRIDSVSGQNFILSLEKVIARQDYFQLLFLFHAIFLHLRTNRLNTSKFDTIHK